MVQPEDLFFPACAGADDHRVGVDGVPRPIEVARL